MLPCQYSARYPSSHTQLKKKIANILGFAYLRTIVYMRYFFRRPLATQPGRPAHQPLGGLPRRPRDGPRQVGGHHRHGGRRLPRVEPVGHHGPRRKDGGTLGRGGSRQIHGRWASMQIVVDLLPRN